MICPLCHVTKEFAQIDGPDSRVFQHCDTCQLVFAAPQTRPSLTEEEAHYLRHENSIENAGYVNFLQQAIQPALPFLRAGDRGLDFGCGPGPTLSQLLANAGYKVDDYDPFFFPELNVAQDYDFIFATECVEHFFRPAKEFELFRQLLKEQGLLIIMTQLWKQLHAFSTWYYAKDPTHVAFYHSRTFDWIEEHFGFKRLYTDNTRVLIFEKNDLSKK